MSSSEKGKEFEKKVLNQIKSFLENDELAFNPKSCQIYQRKKYFSNSRNDYILTDFKSFLFPGLIMMTMLQNSFANSASSIGQSKFQGNIIDVLMAPLNNIELALGYIIGSVCRGIICGLVTTLGVLIFVGLTAYDTQKIKNMYAASDTGEIMGKKAVMGALTLYLDFINLFIMLLRLFGQRR